VVRCDWYAQRRVAGTTLNYAQRSHGTGAIYQPHQPLLEHPESARLVAHLYMLGRA
jgi:hypothetical protein